MKKFGFDLVVQQAADAAGERASQVAIGFEHAPPEFAGDTPIERLLYCALYLRMLIEQQIVFVGLVSARNVQEIIDGGGHHDKLLLQRQIEIDGVGRVDFVIHAYGAWVINQGEGKEGWRKLLVECDGHDFHERTKEQAAKDRSRDRAAALLGYEVFRFTGSELWRDPWACAGQIIEWANRGA